MVLTLKRWKSRTSPGIEAGARGVKKTHSQDKGRSSHEQRPYKRAAPGNWLGPLGVSNKDAPRATQPNMVTRGGAARRPDRHRRDGHTKDASGLHSAQHGDAGWSSPVARQAHNLKVVGSNPTPATNNTTPATAQENPEQSFCACFLKVRPRSAAAIVFSRSSETPG